MAIARELKVIANNLANINTNAFKSEKVSFVEHLREMGNGDKLAFTQDIGLVRDLTEGKKVNTNNSLDLAISGDGFFQVETEIGPRYTRNGAFQLNAENLLVTPHGYPVLDDGGAEISIPPDSQDIKIARDGTVSVGDGVIARIKLMQFDAPKDLKKQAGGLYDPGDQIPKEAENAELVQGMLESSNVIGIVEVSRMMEAMRGYTSVTKLIKQEDERQRTAIRLLGGNNGV